MDHTFSPQFLHIPMYKDTHFTDSTSDTSNSNITYLSSHNSWDYPYNDEHLTRVDAPEFHNSTSPVFENSRPTSIFERRGFPTPSERARRRGKCHSMSDSSEMQFSSTIMIEVRPSSPVHS